MKACLVALALAVGLPGIAAAGPADDFKAAVQQIPQQPPKARPNRAALSRAGELQRLDRQQRDIERIVREASQATLTQRALR